MRYAYHFEFCERPELPEWLRGDLFLSLAFIQDSFGLATVLEREVPSMVRASGARRLVELGSGSGDGLARVARALPGFAVKATDKFPHVALWRQKLADLPHVTWSERSVGFDDFDLVVDRAELQDSIVLLTSAFHHVPASRARGFLERASAAGASVLVVEPLERSFKGVFLGAAVAVPALLFPLVALARKHVLNPLHWLRLAAMHWLVPCIPFFLAHDGLISALRQRTRSDWQHLIKDLPFDLEAREKLGVFRNFSVVLLKRRPVS